MFKQFVEKIKSAPAAMRNRLNQLGQKWAEARQYLLTWFSQKKKTLLWIALFSFLAIFASVVLVYLWIRIPAFRAAGKGAFGAFIAFWVNLRNRLFPGWNVREVIVSSAASEAEEPGAELEFGYTGRNERQEKMTF